MTAKKGSYVVRKYKPNQAVYNELGNKALKLYEIGHCYCDILAKRGRCPKQKGGNCWGCLPSLKTIINQDVSNADNVPAYLCWQLRNYAEGKISIRKQEKKSKPKHFSIDPVKNASKLLERDISNR